MRKWGLLMLLLIAYPLSIGPASRALMVWDLISVKTFNTIYAPIYATYPWLPEPAWRAVTWYFDVWQQP